MNEEQMWRIFFEIHSDLPREGSSHKMQQLATLCSTEVYLVPHDKAFSVLP